MSPVVIVLAKTPVPGQVKSRLSPTFTPEEAAALAAACLRDTFAAVEATPGVRRVLALHGEPGAWVPAGWQVIPQRGRDQAERIAGAFEDTGGPALLIGMDTPQVTPSLLTAALRSLDHADTCLGPSLDGGWWLLGQRRPDRAALDGVPMSCPDTGARQRAALERLGASVADLPWLLDIDTAEDAARVAADAPATELAALHRRLTAPHELAAPHRRVTARHDPDAGSGATRVRLQAVTR